MGINLLIGFFIQLKSGRMWPDLAACDHMINLGMAEWPAEDRKIEV